MCKSKTQMKTTDLRLPNDKITIRKFKMKFLYRELTCSSKIGCLCDFQHFKCDSHIIKAYLCRHAYILSNI